MPKLNNIELASFCERLVGCRYWYGCCLYMATESLRARKAKQYPSHYTDARLAQYKKDIANKCVVADCIGLLKGAVWVTDMQDVLDSIGTGKAIPSKYGSNGCPDKSANGMFTYAKSKGMEWGTIDTLPEIAGVAVHSDGHVGVYVGNGYAVEARGFNYGVVKTRVASRKWTHWYRLPFIDYGDAFGENSGISTAPNTGATNENITLGSRLLKKGMKGADVKVMQEFLLQLGYVLPRYGADGEFGSETETALKAFQKKEGITQDGIYGSESHLALMDAVADDDEGKTDTEPDMEEPVETPAARRVRIVCSGGSVNIRVGNDTRYSRITSAKDGAAFDWVATAENGWHAVVVNGQVGWVSGKYSRVA